jgi:hypothetical protein
MVLFDHVIQIFDLTDEDVGAVCLVVTVDGRFVGLTPVNGDRFRDPVTAARLRQKTPRGFCIPVLREQKVNGLTGLVVYPNSAVNSIVPKNG